MPGFQQKGYGMPPMGYGGRQNHRYEEPDPNGEQFRKLFIGGLSFESNENSLKDYFSKWGEIVDCVVMRDQQTKRSRGFGFITFKDKDSVDEVQRDRKHKVDTRDVETKRAMPRDDASANNQITVNKMFVGGLKEDTTEEMIRSVFSEFGDIKEIELITDKQSGKIKGFCFVTFDDYDPVDKCVLKRRVSVNGRKVEVKKAYAKGEVDPRVRERMMGGHMQMGHMGGRNGQFGRGDYAGGYRNEYDRSFYGPSNYQGHGGMPNYGHGWQGPMYNDYYNHVQPRNNYHQNNYGGHGGYNNRR